MDKLAVTVNCGNIDFELASPHAAIESIMNLALSPQKKSTHVHFANAYSVVLADSNPSLAEVFSSGVCFPDGKPVVWAMKMLHRSRSKWVHQVRGPSFFEEFMRSGVEPGVRHYLLGSTDETLARLTRELPNRIPGVQIVGVSSPPFRHVSDEEWQAELARIKDTDADVVWVGLGTPKQDLIAQKLSQFMPSTYICVGAAFDFSAGNLRHAPNWMQRTGLEWLFRFMQEPRRLWKRYIFGNARFMATVAVQLLDSVRVHGNGKN